MAPENSKKVGPPSWFRVFLLSGFLFFGAFAFYIINFLQIPNPFNWNTLNWNHWGIIPFFTLFLSTIFIIVLLRNNQYRKKMSLSLIILTFLFTVLFLTILTVDNQVNVNFNGFGLLFFMVFSWILATFPILWAYGTHVNNSIEKHAKDYAFLATIAMWLAPLFAELANSTYWYLNGTYEENTIGTVLGGVGFKDVLFILGFITPSNSRTLCHFRPKDHKFLLTIREEREAA